MRKNLQFLSLTSYKKENGDLDVKLEHPIKASQTTKDLYSNVTVPSEFVENPRCKVKDEEESAVFVTYKKENGDLDVKLEHPIKASQTTKDLYSNVIVPSEFLENPRCKVKVVSDYEPVEANAEDTAYEGSDENDDNSIKRELSDFDLQAQVSDKQVTGLPLSRKYGSYDSLSTEANDQLENGS
ncbi:hypothetical protein FRX31_003621 [Thalictrum thalictroides]|uniref:Uncharacterized protein n=1 Tax=Thalictrum thalictroides TaxID=46969 RepID=A0A7J6XCS8_THATH|nr:hypothetical protein FRX31_003621 [Thalictrum thalictroides]